MLWTSVSDGLPGRGGRVSTELHADRRHNCGIDRLSPEWKVGHRRQLPQYNGSILEPVCGATEDNLVV